MATEASISATPMSPEDNLLRPLRVAIIGAGPAGIYAADALMKSDTAVSGRGVSIDLFERMPAPFGLIRYGVAPDHPRIKGIITALHKVLDKPQVRLLGNIDYGTDITLDDLQSFYDAVIFSTGANADRALGIPGIDLDGSYGAADFVSWYDGHPDVPRTWPLEAEKVAVLGVGNVALDIARVLAKTGDELLPTEIPEAIDYDEGSEQARRNSKQVDMVANTLQDWAIRDVGNRPHKLFLHFFESPTEILGEDGKVVGLRTERTQLDGTGNVKGTGTYKDWDVQAVYRAVGYLSQNVTQLPFDDQAGTVPNDAGRVVADDNAEGAARFMPATYVTGWIKRGPVGLIGHTKGDANETVANLLEDSVDFAGAANPDENAVIEFLEGKQVPYTTWQGWYRLDAHERSLGEPEGRERIKVVERHDMLKASEPDRTH